jgi:uncharacterized membrane protein required for colicin V production
MKKVIYSLLAFGPVLALAQTGPGTIVTTATTWANGFRDVVNILIPAFFALAVIYFFYGMAKYILASGDPEKAKEGRGIMIYGVIAIAVMVLLYGLVAFIGSSVGITNPATGPTFPTL